MKKKTESVYRRIYNICKKNSRKHYELSLHKFYADGSVSDGSYKGMRYKSLAAIELPAITFLGGLDFIILLI